MKRALIVLAAAAALTLTGCGDVGTTQQDPVTPEEQMPAE